MAAASDFTDGGFHFTRKDLFVPSVPTHHQETNRSLLPSSQTMSMASFTMKIDFNHIRQLERRKELDELCRHFQSILCNSSAAVLVEGASGTGKSTLVQNFLQKVSSDALICYGKFEERTVASEPFAAIIEAMDTLIEKIMLSGEGKMWGSRIRESLDAEIDLLEDSFPSFRGIVKAARRPSDSTESSESSFYFEGFGDMTDKEWRFERLRLALRSLFRCLSSYAPVVFALDDLHWVDPDSLVLIRTLIHDECKGRKFMFLGTTRPFVASPNLSQCYLDVFPKEKVDMLRIPGLTVSEIISLVADLLKQPDREVVRPFAECLQRHTNGNAFTVIHVLRCLYDKNNFVYNEEKEQWEFDLDRIKDGITRFEEPVEVVRKTLESLDEQERLALMVAASFGTAHFEVTTIVHALEVLEPRKLEETSCLREESSLRGSRRESVDPGFVQNRIRTMKQIMSKLSDKGFVKAQDEIQSQFKFTHDSVREAAYSLLPTGCERTQVHLGIGRQLRLWMDTESELGTSLSHESLVLHAAKHLNVAADLMNDPWELVDLAELNYQAAELVAQKSSFFPALEYLQFGVELLKRQDGWKNHFALAHKLSVALTRIQYSLGFHDDCIKTADEVIAHGDVFKDERAVYHTKFFSLFQQERLDDALDMVLKILKSLGQPFPRRFLGAHLAKDFVKAAKLLKGKKNEELLALPRVDDENLNACIEFMERLAELSKFGCDPTYFSLFSVRLIHLTMERGLFPLSTYAFISWGWVKAESGEHDEAVRFGKLALHLAKDGLGRFRDSRVRVVYWAIISHWRGPYKEGVEPMSCALKEMWDFSAMDYIFFHMPSLSRLMLAAGVNLQSTLTEARKCNECLLDYKQNFQWRIFAPFYQSMLNLIGKAPFASQLTGSVIDEGKCRREWNEIGDKHSLSTLEMNCLFIALFFNDYDRAYDTAIRLRSYPAELTGPDAWVTLRLFYSGLTMAMVSPKKKCRKAKRKAQSAQLQLRIWADEGNVSCKHMCLLLEATISAGCSSCDVDEIISLYSQAGNAACRLSMIHHEALAYELAARFAYQKGASGKAPMYFTRALDLYEAWGAKGKVNQIREEFKFILKQGKGQSLFENETTEFLIED